jgi:hypothetical protein
MTHNHAFPQQLQKNVFNQNLLNSSTSMYGFWAWQVFGLIGQLGRACLCEGVHTNTLLRAVLYYELWQCVYSSIGLKIFALLLTVYSILSYLVKTVVFTFFLSSIYYKGGVVSPMIATFHCSSHQRYTWSSIIIHSLTIKSRVIYKENCIWWQLYQGQVNARPRAPWNGWKIIVADSQSQESCNTIYRVQTQVFCWCDVQFSSKVHFYFSHIACLLTERADKNGHAGRKVEMRRE